MRKSSTIQLGLTLLGLLPAALHAQSSETRTPLEQALATQGQWSKLPLTAADVRTSSAYADPNGLQHVYLQQLNRGIPVYNHLETLSFANGRLSTHAGNFMLSKQLAALSTTPALSAGGAVSRALLQVAPDAAVLPTQRAQRTQQSTPEARQTFDGTGVARRDIVASLTWAIDEAGRAHLAWNVNIELLQSADWWNVRVDAATGLVLGQDNWTVNELATTKHAATGQPLVAEARHATARRLPPPPPTATTASYLVTPYPRENPNRGGLQVETNPWLKAGANNNATTYGWHFDGTTNYAVTRGNNVEAYDDSLKANAPGRYASSTTAAPTLTFQFTPDFAGAPTTTTNRRAATANLFYWNNIVHDLIYQYGFTEAAGNFQADNLGRGGAGNDYVKAEAQDGSGTNNANFSTPPDGASGRMQMFLFSPLTSPINVQVTAPASIAGGYSAIESAFSTANKLANRGPISGQLGLFADAGSSPTTSQACGTHDGPALTGKIALLYRGTCDFVTKMKNAQLAGATAAIVVNNVISNPIAMGGTDNTITIPAVMVSQADGAILASQVANGVQVALPRAIAGPSLDGDYDGGVMAHEYGHGVSTRLTGGPANSSCLTNAEQGGEGWSDYLALMMTTDWSTAQLSDGPQARTTAAYLVGNSGIRRFPYSTSLSVNPLTYANVATNTEVHAIGEIWCAALWDMTWNIIQQRGAIEPNLYNATATGGNVTALQLMVQGLKLQPCQPGFLDARNAILAADSLLYQGQYHAAIWTAFARRGMGYNAVQGLSTSAIDQIAGFDMPPPASLDRPAKLLEGSTFDVALNVRSGLAVPATSFTLTDELPAGMVFVNSSTGGTLSGSKVTFSNITFSTVNQLKTLRFRAYADPRVACTPVLPINDDRDQNTTGGFFSQTLAGSGVWTNSTTRSKSGAAWYAQDYTTPTDFVITSNAFYPTGVSLLSFYHYFDLEPTADGGTVELSTDLGSSWISAAPYFLQNGYNSAFDASVVASREACFSGQSTSAGNNTFIRSILDLRSFIGQPVQIRFRTRTDNGNPATYAGWFIDDIQVLNGCGGIQHVELRDAAGALQSQAADIVTLLLPGAMVTATKTLAQSADFVAHPNPFGTAGLRLALTMPTAQPAVHLTLTDVTGRVLLRRTVEGLATGPNTLLWPEAATLPGGLYLVQLQLPDGSSRTLRVERE